jgi:hypothetical protein
MVESQAREHALSTAIHRPIIAAWEALPLEYRRSLALEDKFDVGLLDEAGEKRLFTRSEVLTMLMYNGQETRRAKLLGGMASTGLTEQKMLQLFTYLKPEDITLANTMWRAFADMAQHTLDLEERRQGVRPEWEEARPFDVHGPDGEVIGKATGGYFPLVAERSGGEQIAQKQEGGTVQQVMASNGYSRATTSQGHTKELTGKVYPLLLDFEQIITAELANQIKDVAYRENILVVDKILRSKQFTDLMVRRLGPEQVEQLGQWLINVVSDHNVGSSKGFRAWNKAVTYINGATTSAVIAYKWGSMVVQPADLTRVLGSSSYGVRPGHLLSAYGELLPGNPKRQTTIDMIKQLSPQMAMREENIDRDLRARIKELSGKDGYYAAFQRGGYAGLTAVDALISWPTWLGSYRQSLAVHGDETRAALEADRTVGLLLQGGAPKDLPTLTGSKDPWVKLITFFMGDATNGYNMLRNAGHNINGMKGIPAFTGATLAIMLGAIIGDLLKGQWPDDDDDAEAWILRKAMLAPAGTVPILRDAANVADNAIAGKPFTDWRFSPAVGTLTKISSALTVHPIKFAKGEESGADFLINEMEGVGYALGVPGTAQATLSAKYFKRVMEGEERPANPAQFGWDFLRGKKKEKR